MTLMANSNRPWYFYLVRCSDSLLYTGIALDPGKRTKIHNAGQGANFTARRRPVVLVYSEIHLTRTSARRREIQLKHWRTEKKEELVADFPRLALRKKLARSE